MKLIQRLSGLSVFLKISSKNQFIQKGSQLGEYFGASLVSADLNGDGLDDLLVGSPLATFEEV